MPAAVVATKAKTICRFNYLPDPIIRSGNHEDSGKLARTCGLLYAASQ